MTSYEQRDSSPKVSPHLKVSTTDSLVKVKSTASGSVTAIARIAASAVHPRGIRFPSRNASSVGFMSKDPSAVSSEAFDGESSSSSAATSPSRSAIRCLTSCGQPVSGFTEFGVKDVVEGRAGDGAWLSRSAGMFSTDEAGVTSTLLLFSAAFAFGFLGEGPAPASSSPFTTLVSRVLSGAILAGDAGFEPTTAERSALIPTDCVDALTGLLEAFSVARAFSAAIAQASVLTNAAVALRACASAAAALLRSSHSADSCASDCLAIAVLSSATTSAVAKPRISPRSSETVCSYVSTRDRSRADSSTAASLARTTSSSSAVAVLASRVASAVAFWAPDTFKASSAYLAFSDSASASASRRIDEASPEALCISPKRFAIRLSASFSRVSSRFARSHCAFSLAFVPASARALLKEKHDVSHTNCP